MPIDNSYSDNHVDFEITNIQVEDDTDLGSPENADERIEELRTREESIVNILDKDQSGEGNVDLSDRQTDSLFEDLEEVRDEIQSIQNQSQNPTASITFEYSAPAISVDTSGRFIKHEIIGGTTVRQKIGEDPMNIDVNGVCKESTAKKLDELRNAKYGRLVSNRLPSSINVQFASTSTSPLNDGGAVALSDDDGEFLYQYTISAVEVDI